MAPVKTTDAITSSLESTRASTPVAWIGRWVVSVQLLLMRFLSMVLSIGVLFGWNQIKVEEPVMYVLCWASFVQYGFHFSNKNYTTQVEEEHFCTDFHSLRYTQLRKPTHKYVVSKVGIFGK